MYDERRQNEIFFSERGLIVLPSQELRVISHTVNPYRLCSENNLLNRMQALTMTLEDRFDPPTFASSGADKWIIRKVERNGADAWANLANIGIDVFFGRSLGFIARSKSS